jgi:hypothetical protein
MRNLSHTLAVPRFFALLLLLPLCALTASPQFNKAPTVAESNPAISFNDGNRRDDPNSFAHHQMLEKIFLLRQKEMAENTDCILRLATDLNTEINHPTSQLHHEPADSLHKAETIAKLAHSIRQQMAGNDIH